jgi:hypothetical protein
MPAVKTDESDILLLHNLTDKQKNILGTFINDMLYPRQGNKWTGTKTP